MSKRDPIFWWATGIFVLSLLLMAVTQNQLWLVLMIGSYLLRPTLASLGFARRYVDERQMSINYRSGNIAFTTMIIACIILAIKLNADGNPDWEMFNIAIIIGLATKALFNVLLVMNPREAATKVIISVGLLLTLFVSMESVLEGFSLGTILRVGSMLTIVGVGLLSKKLPRISGGLMLVITAVFLFVIFKKGVVIGQVATAIIVSVPLAIAAIFLIIPDKNETEIAPIVNDVR